MPPFVLLPHNCAWLGVLRCWGWISGQGFFQLDINICSTPTGFWNNFCRCRGGLCRSRRNSLLTRIPSTMFAMPDVRVPHSSFNEFRASLAEDACTWAFLRMYSGDQVRTSPSINPSLPPSRQAANSWLRVDGTVVWTVGVV